MNRLVKGAEISFSSVELFSRVHTTGDLASNLASRGGVLLMMSKTRNDYFNDARASSIRTIPSAIDHDSEDISDLAEIKKNRPNLQLNIENSLLPHSNPFNMASTTPITTTSIPQTPISLLQPQLSPSASEALPGYGQITIESVTNLPDLSTQAKNIQFRNLFRLPLSEIILFEDMGVSFHLNDTTVTGSMMMSQSFLTFTAVHDGIAKLNDSNSRSSFTTTSSVSSASTLNPFSKNNIEDECENGDLCSAPISPSSPSISTSSHMNELNFFDTPMDATITLVVPFSHITSIQKVPPTSVSAPSILSSLGLGGELYITTRGKKGLWFSFGGSGSGSRAMDAVVAGVKRAEWVFDGGEIGEGVTLPEGVVIDPKLDHDHPNNLYGSTNGNDYKFGDIANNINQDSNNYNKNNGTDLNAIGLRSRDGSVVLNHIEYEKKLERGNVVGGTGPVFLKTGLIFMFGQQSERFGHPKQRR